MPILAPDNDVYILSDPEYNERVAPTTPERLRQQILPKLRDQIISGALAPGSRLIESAVSARSGVSRTPLREALLQLEREGLVRSDLRRGFTVTELSTRELRETYPLLVALECHAAQADFEFLHLLLPELTRVNRLFARARGPKWAMELDARWHETLLSQSRNSRLLAMIAGLRQAVQRYEFRYMSDVKLIATSAAQHAHIATAIEKNNLAATLAGIELNYLFGMRLLLRQMGEE